MSDNHAALAHVKGTKLAAYGDRDEVREMADRLLALHPEAKNIGSHGMRAVAQLAILVGASPLPATNEIHVWLDNKGNINMALGINFYRRKAAEWGGVLWKTQPRAMTQQETEEWGVGDNEIGAICSAVTVEDMLRYREMGFTTNEIWDMAARVGVATVTTKKTNWGDYSEAKNGRPLIWTALKRAEVDLYRALFPVQMAQVEDNAPPMDGVQVQRDGYVETVAYRRRDETDDDMDLDEFNRVMFDAEPADAQFREMDGAAETPEVDAVPDAPEQDSDSEPVDQTAVEEAASAAPDKQESMIADLRASIEATAKPTIGQVASALVATGLYTNEHHATQALKGYPDWPKGFKVAKSAQVTAGGGLKLLDWAVARKSEEE